MIENRVTALRKAGLRNVERIVTEPWVQELCRLLANDPGRRGIGHLLQDGTLRPDLELSAAASLLGGRRGEAVIVTGFPILTERGVKPETDGPPGAVLLAATLADLGWRTCIVCEAPHFHAVRAILDTLGIEKVRPIEWSEHLDGPPWTEAERTEHRERVLISVERPGPAYVTAPVTDEGTEDPVFYEVVPEPDRGQLHSFRGAIISGFCAPLHWWFDSGQRSSSWTIGIGDGGNEIGFGRVPWRTLQTTVAGGHGGVIACSIPTDFLIVSGVSNWAAYALALASARVAGDREAAGWVTTEMDRAAVQAAVEQGGAVDGVTGQPVPLVDGLGPEEHARFLNRARSIVGW